MPTSRFFKEKDETLTCPFCKTPLTHNVSHVFTQQSQKGYDCLNCVVPGAFGANDKPYSRYTVGVSLELMAIGQFIMLETFVIHLKDNQWYNVYNNLAKEQTNIVLVEPARKEHFLEGEKVQGLVHVGNPAWFRLIDTWNPADQAATLEKIKTYLLFL
jgi:hypothetical protein